MDLSTTNKIKDKEPAMNKNYSNIISWNTQGLRTSKPNLKILCSKINPSVLCLQETMCSSKDQANINGYSIYYRPRAGGDRAAGGVLVGVKPELDSEEIDLDTNLEAIAVKVGPPFNLTIINTYLPPGQAIQASDIVHLINQVPQPRLLVGDINAHHPLWGSETFSARGLMFEEVLNECNLVVLNKTDPTHISVATGTLTSIDVACCSTEIIDQLDFSVLQDSYGSDHLPLLLTLPDTAHAIRTRPKWKIEEADWETFQTTVQFPLMPTATQQISSITQKILEAAEQTIPKTTGLVNKRAVPWWNQEVASAVKSRKKALRALQSAKRNNSENQEALAAEFRAARSHARKVIQEAQRTSWINFVNDFTVQTPVKEVWENFRRIQGKCKTNRISAITAEGGTVSKDEDIAEALASSFASISSNDAYSPEFRAFKDQVEQTPLSIPADTSAEYNKPFLFTEFEEATAGLRGSSPGPDTVHYSMIVKLPLDCKRQLLDAYNRLWLGSVYPPEWTESLVIPVFKNCGEKANPRNYRPIFLNSCLGKVFERMVNNRLVHIIETRRLLHPHQFAFRKGKTTVDHLAELEKVVRAAWNKKEYVQGIFLDVTKAYDTTWRRLVLKQLRDWNIEGLMLKFLDRMLENRSFRVFVNGQLSQSKIMETGLCQGSVLSVTLFLVAINTLVARMPPSITTLLYADDVVLLASGRDVEEVENDLQAALKEVECWQSSTGFKISAEKSATVIFRSYGTRKPPSRAALELNGTLIPTKKQHRCLGVILDQHLLFKTHCEEVKAACRQRVQLIRCVASRSWGGDRKTLIKLYRATVLEKILYAAPITAAVSDNVLKILEPTHNTGLRAICGAFRTSPVDSLQAETGIPSLRVFFEQRTAIYAARRAAISAQSITQPAEDDSQSAGSSTESSYDSNSSGEEWNSTRHRGPHRLVETAETRGKAILEELELPLPELKIFTLPSCPPWERRRIRIDKTLLEAERAGATSTQLKELFVSRRNTEYRLCETIFTDGSKKDGRVGYAMVRGDLVVRRRISDLSSIFAAECGAITEALRWIIGQNRVGTYLVCTDSFSAITALGKRKTKCRWKDEINILHNQAECNGTEIIYMWVKSHVGIAGNEKADEEAKQSLNDRNIWDRSVEFKEFRTVIKKRAVWRWNAEWSGKVGNKLREVKNSVLPYRDVFVGSRKEDVILTRLRIGHTLLTHQYLLEKDSAPRCTRCNLALTVKHILAECPEFEEQRRRAGVPSNVREALADDRDMAKNVLKFLKATDMYGKV